MPPLSELAQPMLRLAGIRLNPATNGPHRAAGLTAVTFKSLSDGRERRVSIPGSTSLVTIGFSPDGKHYALGVVAKDGVTLRMVNPATGQVSPVPGVRLNAMFGLGASGPGAARGLCGWTDDSSALYCPAVPARRLAPPAAPAAPAGPDIQQTSGRAAPVRTYQDLLKSAHDEALFEYYGTSQIVRVDAASLKVTPVGEPGLFRSFAPSPEGKYLLVDRIVRPFSCSSRRHVPAARRALVCHGAAG